MIHEGARKGEPRWSMPSLRRLPRLPRLPVAVAAALTGLVCGVVATLLVWSGERGCDAVRERPSCGGYGFLMLTGIMVVCFLVGVALLRGFGAEHVGVTTFFGLALSLLVVLALLLDYAFDTWMAFALPVLAGICFVLAVYIARALDAANPSPYADNDEEGPRDDGDDGDAFDVFDDADQTETPVDDLPRSASTDDR